MFTGIVEACVAVHRVRRSGTGLQLWVEAPPGDWDLGIGDSICVSGACLSVAELSDRATGRTVPAARAGTLIAFELTDETLRRTWLSRLETGRRVNLERALELGDRLDGHLVAGHVDGLGRVVSVADSGDGGRHLTVEVEPTLERFLVDKGSITVDGVSLTVVAPEGRRFGVALIPITLRDTSLGDVAADQAVNIEVDMIAKWIERLMPRSVR